MKKIAELVIGNMIVSNTMYEDYGSPTLFIVHKDDRKSRCYYSYGYYQARCINCGAMFTVKPNITWYGGSVKVFCPACGRVHTGNAIMYGDNPESLLPDNIVMKVVDFKDKVELRLKYKAVYFGRFTYKTYSYVADVKETYTFDVKNAKVHWRKTESNIVLEDKEIGYVKDFFELKEKTALWFYSINHKINKGNSFGELLKALRNAVNKKIKAEGKTPKPLYIGGNYKNRLYGNVLNLAHRVRFWDAKNIKQLAYGEYDTVMFERKILGKEYLPERFEEKLYAAMQKTDYISALCKVLKVPNIPHTRKNLTYENFALLHICYTAQNIDAAQALFERFKGHSLSVLETIKEIIKLYNTFIAYYPKMQIKNVLGKWNTEYRDILNLWESADKVTKNTFRKTVPPLSKLHDWLSVEVAKQDGREIIFDVPQEVINRYTVLMKVFGKGFGAKCIEKNSELKFWATSLNNCAAGYAKRINGKEQLVGISDDRGKPVALLEIRSNKLIQAKLFDNRRVRNTKDVNKTVLEFAERCGLKISTNDVLIPGEEKEMPMAGIA